MSTDYKFACYNCKKMSPLFASASISYGFKVWKDDLREVLEWFGDGEDVGNHENHDVRLINEHVDLPWEEE